MNSSREESVVSKQTTLTTRRPFLRALAGVGALGALGLSATPVAATPIQPGGSGTELDPYVITTVQELQWIGTGTAERRRAHYVLGNNINASETAHWNGGAGFTPIESFSAPGTFDGQGYAIAGLVINRPTGLNVGLFGSTSDATIMSVHLTDVDITGENNVGGLVGRANGGTVRDASASGTVTGNGAVGRLVGLVIDATVRDSSARGRVTGNNYVGGLVGDLTGFRDEASVSGSSARGRVTGENNVGGLVGGTTQVFGTASVSDTSARGRVTGTSSIGGLVGSNSGTICGSEARGSVSGTEDVGDLVGLNQGVVEETCS